jgi:tripartite ATP-independent transporter DctM subunit
MWWSLLGPFGLFLIIGVPVAIAIGVASVLYLLLTGLYPQMITVQRIVLTVEAWPLIAVPLFILAGGLLASGRTGILIMDFAQKLVGHLWGGLAAALVVANMIMGGISGSAAADASGLGSIGIPQMKKRGYPAYFAVSLNACASPIGILIPPSIPMILFSWVSGASVAKLFLGGLIPGILVGIVQIIIVMYTSKKHGWYRDPRRASAREILEALVYSWPALLAPILLIGSILSGIFTATEVASGLFVYALIVECGIYRTYTLRGLLEISGTSARTVGVVMLVIATSNIFSHILVTLHVPEYMTETVFQVTRNPVLILVWINIALLIVGCFMDLTPAILIFSPVIIPICHTLGMNDIQIGVMIVLNLAIGLFTPPVGTTLYISCGIGQVGLEEGSRGILPFLFGMIIVLALVTQVPWISMGVGDFFLGK